MARVEAQTIGWRQTAPVIEQLEQSVPADGRLGYVLRYNDWIYPFYGPDLTRRLVKLPRDGLFAAAEQRDLEAVIVAGKVPELPRGWRAIQSPAIDAPATEWTLLLR